MKTFGLNLFSLRSLIQTEKEFLSVAETLKKQGYAYLQFSGASLPAETIKKVSEESGMPIVLTHMPMNRIVNDTERLMEEHALYGCRNIGLGMMPLDIIKDEKKCKETIAALNKAGEKMEQNGFRFFYHHHHFEFVRYGDETVLDYMIRTAPHINFTADTYWLQYGGADVCAYLKKLSGRISCVHLKDYRVQEKKDGSLAPEFAPVGDGSFDFKTIVREAETSGTEYFLVEQDNAVEYADPLEQVARSAAYLKKEIAL